MIRPTKHCSRQNLYINPLTDNKILGLPKLKASADDKSNVTQNIKVVFNKIENIVGKEENAGYQHFFPPQCFSKGLFLKYVKSHRVLSGNGLIM